MLFRSYLFGDVPVDGEADQTPDEQPAAGQVNADVDLENEDDIHLGDEVGPNLEEEQPDLPPPLIDDLPAAGANGVNNGIELGEAHQALLQRQGPTGFQPYHKPTLFPLRVRKNGHNLLTCN